MRCLLASFALAAASSLAAQVPPAPAALPPVDLSGADSTYDFDTGLMTVRGEARLDTGEGLLLADEITYNRTTRVATARGHVRLTRGAQRVLADEAVYDATARTFDLRGVRLGQFPYYLSAARAQGDRDQLVLTDAALTYGEPSRWAPTIRAGRAELRGDQAVELDDARLGLGLSAPLPLPGYRQSLGSAFVEEVKARAGYSDELGLYFDVGALVPVNAHLRLGSELGYYTERGVLLGPGARYRFGAGDDAATGSLRTGFIHDNGNRLTDLLGRDVPADRGFAQWSHRQRFGERVTLAGEAAWWRDSEVTRDFRERDFSSVQVPDTFLEAVYAGDSYSVSLFARAQPNTFHVVQQRLPELRFDGLPTELGLGVIHRTQASAVRLVEDALLQGEKLESDRLDGYYALTRPFAPTSWLAFNPVIGGRATHYLEGNDGGSVTRTLGEIGFDSELRASGTFAYKNERWGIDGLRHLITPRVSYRYITSDTEAARRIPRIDRDVFATYLEPLGLGDRRDIDTITGLDVMRVALDQRLQTRDATYGSRDLARLQLAADIDLSDRLATASTTTDDPRWSDLHLDAAVTPAPWLEFGLYARFDLEDHGIVREFNPTLVLRDGDVWSLAAAVHSLAADTQEYRVALRYRLSETFAASARVNYDARRDRFPEQSVALEQVLANTWRVRYEVAFFDGRRRGSDFGLRFELDLLSF